MEKNFNKFEQQLVGTQNKLKEHEGIIEESFYNYNNIHESKAYKMPDKNYLVYFYTDEYIERNNSFEKIVNDYRGDIDSFEVYVAETEGDVRIEFITNYKNEFTLENIWYSTDEIEKLPYRTEESDE